MNEIQEDPAFIMEHIHSLLMQYQLTIPNMTIKVSENPLWMYRVFPYSDTSIFRNEEMYPNGSRDAHKILNPPGQAFQQSTSTGMINSSTHGFAAVFQNNTYRRGLPGKAFILQWKCMQ